MSVSSSLSDWKTAGVYLRLLFCLLRERTGKVWVWFVKDCPPSGRAAPASRLSHPHNINFFVVLKVT